jgi:hypothetical protein
MTDMEGRAMDRQILVELMFGFGAPAAGAAIATLVMMLVLRRPNRPRRIKKHAKNQRRASRRSPPISTGFAEGTAARQRDMADPSVVGGRANPVDF